MDVQVKKDMDVTCDLLIPSDDEEMEEVTCIKCNGTQMNKKGLHAADLVELEPLKLEFTDLLAVSNGDVPD